MPKIPLIEDLTNGPVLSGSQILVEFDPASQWYNASISIAAGWLKTGGRVSYYGFALSPDSIRSQLNQLGVNAGQLEQNGALEIWDWYTVTLGLPSKEKFTIESLKVADLSLHVLKVRMQGPVATELLAVADDISVLDRFNDEKAWVEYELARSIPSFRSRKVTCIRGVINGLHTSLVYKRLEAANDGIVDFKLETSGQEALNMMRIRTMRNLGFDSRWAQLDVDPQTQEVRTHRP